MMSHTVKWGIVGTGWIAGEFAHALQQAGAGPLTAIASRDLVRARQFAASFPGALSFGSYGEMYSNPEVDVVYIATPHVRHHQDCLEALRAGKHVLCEKPLAMNAQQAREIAAAAAQHDRFCMEAMWMRFMPLVLQLRDWLAKEKLGSPCALTGSFGVPTAWHPQSRFYDPELGGGALLDRGVYLVSLAHFLFGAPDHVAAHALVGKSGVDEHTSFLLRYAAGHRVTGECSLRCQLPNDALVVGERGSAKLDEPFFRPHRLSFQPSLPEGRESPSQVTRANRSGIRQKTRRWLQEHPIAQRWKSHLSRLRQGWKSGAAEQLFEPVRGNGYAYEAREVAQCVTNGQRQSKLMPLDESVAVLETLDRLTAAAR
jgi:predicted dehydrogenase